MPVSRRLAPFAVLALLAGPLVACGDLPPSTTPVRAGANASLADMTDKIDSIALDECATKPAASVFPNCPRFVTEVGNAAVAVAGGAPGHPGAAALEAAANAVGDDVARFVRDGCVSSPSQAAPAVTTCGPDLQRIQDGLRTMRSALRVSAATTTPAPPTS